MNRPNKKIAIIIGAGPAGLTAAYELLNKTNITPIIYEEGDQVGGLSKTLCYNGNRIDIGGHRFFSKSDIIMDRLKEILEIQENDIPEIKKAMLVKKRISRIYFLKKFFDYPIKLNLKTVSNLGILKILKIGFSYIESKIKPIYPEKSLEDFFINRFGNNLYTTFFKDYTEKVWGVSCDKISPEWGSQRVKGLNLLSPIVDIFKKINTKSSISQKNIETSLIEKFLYPKLGPGQMWEEIANRIQKRGGKIFLNHKAIAIHSSDKNRIIGIEVKNSREKFYINGDYFISSMPVKNLIAGWTPTPPSHVVEIANGLKYRDFITIGVLLEKIKIKNESEIKTDNDLIQDNWIYIQEKNIKMGRIQIFNNWSKYMVEDQKKIWIGLEYFCDEGDEFWEKSEDTLKKFAIQELTEIGFADAEDVIDCVVIKVKGAYPAYLSTYNKFDSIKEYLNKYENLFLIGRNGMHRYNNMDHSMLSAMASVENILNNVKSKSNIWEINEEKNYHEER